MMRWLRLGLPLAVLVALAALLARGLQFDPKNLPSAMVGKPAPAISLPILSTSSTTSDASNVSPISAPSIATFDSTSLRGQVWIMNVFASWCGACVAEHPRLLRLASGSGVPLIGLAYKDNPADTQAWLRQYGNPYRQVALDVNGRLGIDYGVYGVPETYVIDRNGVIHYRHAGPIGSDFFDRHVAPLLAASSTEKTASEKGMR